LSEQVVVECEYSNFFSRFLFFFRRGGEEGGKRRKKIQRREEKTRTRGREKK
jgi:hypothetical protein